MSDAGAAGFRRVLGADGFAAFATSSLLGRLIGGMAPLAIVLYVHHAVGSFGAAGAATAAFALGLGLTGPVLARLVDTRGRGLLVPMATACALALTALVALGNAGAAPWLLVLAAALAGAASPPLNGVTRHRLPELVGRADVSTAYAVDSILLELIFISGPLLAGGLAATVGPGEGLVLAGVIALLGASWFALELPPHRLDPDLGPRSRLGALGSPAIRMLTVGGLPIGVTLGALEVALPAFGLTHGSAALGGLFAAALSVGSGLGGVAYGARPRALGPPRRSLIRLTALQAVLVLPLLIGPPVPAMLVLAAIAGLWLAPLLSVRSELVREQLPAGTGAEAFTWTTLTVAVGAGIGSALAGPLVEAGGWRSGVALACLGPAAGFLFTLARRHVL
ncbi:MAG: hypothetical protein JST31_16465 [Actinobacteria bacterium]|nr:hypothetical protein [Actinomycetota bacterium]